MLVAWLQAALVYQAVDHFGLVFRRTSQQLQHVVDGLAQNRHRHDGDDLSQGGHVFTPICCLSARQHKNYRFLRLSSWRECGMKAKEGPIQLM